MSTLMPWRQGWRRFVLAGIAVVFLSGFGSGERLFAPSAELWPRWQANDPTATTRIDHRVWSEFLQRYLSRAPRGFNQLAYGAVTAGDRQALDGYIAALAAQPISRFNRAEQEAYWINLYNALTVRVVLDYYPVTTIREINISPGFFATGPWGKALVRVEGIDLSLDDIEHRILRPIWRDPRLHYALNCAAISCPDLQGAAFLAPDLERQLEQAARQYVNDPRGVAVIQGKVIVSKVYDWFIEDFGGSEQTVLAHLKRYAAPALKAQLKAINRLDDVRYDWSLNGAPGSAVID